MRRTFRASSGHGVIVIRAVTGRIGNIEATAATAPPCGGLPAAPGIPASPWLSAGPRAILIALPDEGALATGTRQGARERSEALIVFAHGFAYRNRSRIAELAARQRLPAMFGWREFVEAEGLMSYGPNVRAHGAACGDLRRQDPQGRQPR